MTLDSDRLLDFARRYTEAWCSRDPARVAEHYASEGLLTINGGTPSVGRAAITEAARLFMTAFPDMQVLMDDVIVKDDATEYHWTLVGTNTGPGGTGNRVRILRARGVDDRRRRPRCGIAGPLRPSRIRPAARTGGVTARQRCVLVAVQRVGRKSVIATKL